MKKLHYLKGIRSKCSTSFVWRSLRLLYKDKRVVSLLVVITLVFTYSAIFIPKAHAASQGPYNATTASGSGWTSATSAEACDGTDASVSLASASSSSAIVTEGYGFSLPAGTTINGVQVDVTKYATTGADNTIEDTTVSLVVGGTASGSNLGTTSAWPSSAADVTYGSSSTLWGLTPTVAQINASNFGVSIGAQNAKTRSGKTSSLTAYVDCIDVTVTYTSPTLTQSDYRFFNNANSTTPGTPLAATNTSITTPGDGQPFRLRQEIAVSGVEDAVNDQYLELQYASMSGGSCGATPSANFTNVSNSSAIGYYSNSGATNGATITSSGNDPSDGNTIVYETYQQSGTTTFANPIAIPVGEDGMWDFALTTNDTVAGTDYCLRLATSNGVALNGYNQYPEIVTPSSNLSQSTFRFYKNQDASSTAGTWTQAGSTVAALNSDANASAVFNNEMWIMGGSYASIGDQGSVYYSNNGSSWTQATSSAWGSSGARDDMASAVFNNNLWVMGGESSSGNLNDVWCSSNGSTWSDTTCGTNSAAWPIRHGAQAVVLNGKIYLMGGDNSTGPLNDVWSSSDGTNWTEVTAAAPWGARYDFSAVVYNNDIWVMGGENTSGSSYYNDVWYSSDGLSWTEATTSAGWAPRYGASLVAANNKMWLLAGGIYNSKTGINTEYNDVWTSTDGITWTEVTSSAAWSARTLADALVYNNDIWMIAGVGGQLITYPEDAWYLTLPAIDVGLPLGEQSVPIDLTKYDNTGGMPENLTASPFRLRWNITDSLSGVALSGGSFNLQYAEMIGGSCETTGTSGVWANVASTTPIQFYTGNANASNGMTLIPDTNDPTDGSNTIDYQTYVDANPFSNTQSAVYNGQDGLWDFALIAEANPPHTNYCLRIYNNNTASVIISNNTYPEIDMAPTMTQLLRGREWWNASGVREFKDL